MTSFGWSKENVRFRSPIPRCSIPKLQAVGSASS
jgi:hypothetical protein